MLLLRSAVEEEFRPYKVGCTSDCKQQHSLLGHMDEESIPLSAGSAKVQGANTPSVDVGERSYILHVCLCAGTSKPDLSGTQTQAFCRAWKALDFGETLN